MNQRKRIRCSLIYCAGFGDGQLTDGLGNTVDFRNTIIHHDGPISARGNLQKRTAMGFQSGRR